MELVAADDGHLDGDGAPRAGWPAGGGPGCGDKNPVRIPRPGGEGTGGGGEGDQAAAGLLVDSAAWRGGGAGER